MDPVRTWAMARKEAIQLRRDPRSLALAFLLPVMLLLFFGYAISWDVRDLPLAVTNHDEGGAGRDLVAALEASGYFRVSAVTGSAAAADSLLSAGRAVAALILPPGFTRDLGSGRPAAVQLLLDGVDANTATIALSAADAVVASFSASASLQGRRLGRPVRVESRAWYNPELRSRNMIVPGLIAVIMSIIAAMLTALTIAREWERGTMEQLAATPVGRFEVVIGKLLPYLGIGLFDVLVAAAAGVVVFGVPFQGSIVLLAVLTLLFLAGALGLGIFISALLKSQLLAMQVAMVVTYLPALLLSGFLFDIASMPAALRGITYIVPARYYVVVTRGVFLKGVGLEALWLQALLMLAFAVAGLALATTAFRKEIAR
jgi:ABC-2 type transport system permease protein